MSEVERIAEALAGDPGYPTMNLTDYVRFVISQLIDAPKSALWAGALHAKSDSDLEVWNAMLREMLRE